MVAARYRAFSCVCIKLINKYNKLASRLASEPTGKASPSIPIGQRAVGNQADRIWPARARLCLGMLLVEIEIEPETLRRACEPCQHVPVCCALPAAKTRSGARCMDDLLCPQSPGRGNKCAVAVSRLRGRGIRCLVQTRQQVALGNHNFASLAGMIFHFGSCTHKHLLLVELVFVGWPKRETNELKATNAMRHSAARRSLAAAAKRELEFHANLCEWSILRAQWRARLESALCPLEQAAANGLREWQI